MRIRHEAAPSRRSAPSPDTIERLVATTIGEFRARAARRALEWPDGGTRDDVSRAELALALCAVLFDGVQRRVPMARAYVLDAVREGRRLVFDHGALRTVATDCGALPAGAAAFGRILEPLGYERAGLYPLERLGMTGFAYRHVDHSHDVPQFFVSELHPERFSPGFRAAVERVVGSSRDPLTPRAVELLDALAGEERLPFGDAAELLPELARCFERQHEEPTLADYERLLAESAEMAWIATEGNAFNHATDRVGDVFEVADLQRRLGRPVKDVVEVSSNGRVLQTALRAAPVERLFRHEDGQLVTREVPGSFHEFITRKAHPDGGLDLTFDAGNATSIFGMTSVGRETA